jgi:hypothetical protein
MSYTTTNIVHWNQNMAADFSRGKLDKLPLPKKESLPPSLRNQCRTSPPNPIKHSQPYAASRLLEPTHIGELGGQTELSSHLSQMKI